MPSALARVLPYVVVGALAAWLFHEATQIDFHRRAGTLGPDVWPKLILGAMLAVCVYEVARLLLSPRYRGGAAGVLQEMVERGEAAHGEAEPPAPRSPLRLLGGIALTVLYVWALQRLGFVQLIRLFGPKYCEYLLFIRNTCLDEIFEIARGGGFAVRARKRRWSTAEAHHT